jgi:hypothetical protein
VIPRLPLLDAQQSLSILPLAVLCDVVLLLLLLLLEKLNLLRKQVNALLFLVSAAAPVAMPCCGTLLR